MSSKTGSTAFYLYLRQYTTVTTTTMEFSKLGNQLFAHGWCTNITDRKINRLVLFAVRLIVCSTENPEEVREQVVNVLGIEKQRVRVPKLQYSHAISTPQCVTSRWTM